MVDENGYTIIDSDARSSTNYYIIPGTDTHIFPFLIQSGQKSNIAITAVSLTKTQTGSLRLWFSASPFGQALFSNLAYLNPLFISETREQVIDIWDANAFPGQYCSLDPAMTYYINVQNVQARPTSYRLIFS